MGAVLAFNIGFEALECGECGTYFAMTNVMYNKRKEDGKVFFCPLGHQRVFRETEVMRLKKQLEQKDRDLEWQRAQRNRAEKHASAMKGQVTKIKNRVGNGVCPCCKRTFQNLLRHMKHQHPEFKNGSHD